MKQVYTPDDLASRERLDADADLPARLAVVGYPVAHSASPRMHQAALDAHSIDMRYIRLEVEPGRMEETFSRMRTLGFWGCNVTIPHKFTALAYCDHVDSGAKMLGAVNTIRFENGQSQGFNTDGPGFARAIECDFGKSLGTLSVALIGAGGGAGQALAAQCIISGVRKLVLVNRTLEKLEPLAKRLERPGVEILTLAFDHPDLARHCQSCDLVVNTTSVGLKEGDPTPVPAGCLRQGQWVYDTIYLPEITPLLAVAQTMGCITSNGKSMLIHQGALAFQRWFPDTQPLQAMRAALAANY